MENSLTMLDCVVLEAGGREPGKPPAGYELFKRLREKHFPYVEKGGEKPVPYTASSTDDYIEYRDADHTLRYYFLRERG